MWNTNHLSFFSVETVLRIKYNIEEKKCKVSQKMIKYYDEYKFFLSMKVSFFVCELVLDSILIQHYQL